MLSQGPDCRVEVQVLHQRDVSLVSADPLESELCVPGRRYCGGVCIDVVCACYLLQWLLGRNLKVDRGNEVRAVRF